MTVETITKAAGTTTAFPKAEVAAQSDAALKGIALPSDKAGQAAASVQLDSLEVVSLLCEIEPIVEFELKDSLVRTGGYSSVNRAMEHLMPRIEKAWEKNGSKGAKK